MAGGISYDAAALPSPVEAACVGEDPGGSGSGRAEEGAAALAFHDVRQAGRQAAEARARDGPSIAGC